MAALLASAAPLKNAPTLLSPVYLTSGGTTPALEVLYSQNAGAEAVGGLQNVLYSLLALCPANADGNTYSCAAYEQQRQSLWAEVGSLICGFPGNAWTGPPNLAQASVDAALEYLLAQCTAPFTGSITQLVQTVVANFTSLSAQLRPDVATVVAASAAAVGLNSSNATAAQLAPFYVSLFPALAPLPAAGREPAVVTNLPPPPAVAAQYVAYQPAREQSMSSIFPETQYPDATVQQPAALIAAVLATANGQQLYQKYLNHPNWAVRLPNSTYTAH